MERASERLGINPTELTRLALREGLPRLLDKLPPATEPHEVEQFAQQQKASGLRNKTAGYCIIIIRAVLNFGLKHGLLRNNPVRAATLKFLKDRTPQLTVE